MEFNQDRLAVQSASHSNKKNPFLEEKSIWKVQDQMASQVNSTKHLEKH